MKFTNNIIVSGTVTLSDEAYSSSWNGKLEAPTKNALWDILGAGLDYVPLTRQLTIDGTTYDLTANRSWTTGAITSLTGEATASGPGAASVTLTNSAVIGKVLTGLNVTGGTVLSTDTILEALGKTQNQINGLIGGLNYQGVWNASTNTPSLTSSVGTKGYYYKVSVAGSTSLDGTSTWQVGDWAIFNGTIWDKVDNTDSVSSVNGYIGAVSLITDDISEGVTNLYYTNARARAAISLTTTGSSGAATYNSTTGVLNVPDYGAGQFWTRAITTLSPATANDKIFASSASGSTFESLNTGIGGLAFYGNSTNGIGAQFQSGSAGEAGLIVKNIGGGPIQQWFDHSSTVASVANNGNFTATAFITTGGTASQVVLGNGTLGTLVTSADYIQNQVAGAQTAGFKISGDGTLANLTASTKVNVASPSGTTGDVNTGQAGIYSYRSAGRYVRFNTSGTFNDFLSLGAKLVMNYGFSGTVENISMFEGSAAGDGQFIVGSPTATNARFLLKGKDTGTTNYISRWFDSGNTEKFSVRNDGQTTVASLAAGGIVKSTAGVLSIATADTDYAPATGGTGYIQNQYSVIQTASMAISGRATIADGVIAGGAPGITGVPRFIINQAASGNIQVEFPTSTATTLAFTTATGAQTITFPDATGTVALTSALGSYLPLAGGTLSGALTGTSATFSEVITSTLGNNANIFNSISATTGYQFMRMQNTGASAYWGIEGSTVDQVTSSDVAYSTTFGTLNSTSLHLATNQTVRCTIDSSGSIRWHAYGAGTLTTDASGNMTATSDMTLKILDSYYTKGLSALRDITPINHYWTKESGLDTKAIYTGFSAQNIQQSIPEAVGRMSNGKLTLQDRPIMATVVNAIKELDNTGGKALQEALIRIEELERKLNLLLG